ncbi:cell envelope integrity protein CreD [Patescibacteria group bacterium]
MDVLKSFQRGSSISLKLLVIGVLIIFFIPATAMVQNLIEERSERQQDTVVEVSEKWGQEQTLVGPILHVPYTSGNSINYSYFLPENLKINGAINSEIRSRGIYNVPLYESELMFSGKFNHPDLDALGINPETVLWDQVFLALEVPDMRGITQKVMINWNGSEKYMNSGVTSTEISSGLGANVTVDVNNPREYDFNFTLNLRGSELLYFMPIGKETTIEMASNWLYPSFDGAFLPLEHTIDSDGFKANWNILDLNTDFPQHWTEKNVKTLDLEENAFGVKLFLPVDVYQKSTRSVKYAIAVIGLVFLTIFLVEITAKKRIHPLQYILIGFALIIFYTLLLSLAEYIKYAHAYLIASLSIIAMVTLFTRSVMKSWRIGFVSGAILAALYGFVYVLLQMQDLTLLIGSVGLFMILAGVMYVSRRIDWYGKEDV